MKLQTVVLGLISAVMMSSFGGQAHASGAAGALFGVQTANVHLPLFANTQASEGCGLSKEELGKQLKQIMETAGIPAVTLDQPRPPIVSIARVELIPDIVSTNQGLDCVSWISLSVESDERLVIQPVELLRETTVQYWTQGALISSGQAEHQRTVVGAMQKMIDNLAKKFRKDQIR